MSSSTAKYAQICDLIIVSAPSTAQRHLKFVRDVQDYIKQEGSIQKRQAEAMDLIMALLADWLRERDTALTLFENKYQAK
jgi:hypothetical protein